MRQFNRAPEGGAGRTVLAKNLLSICGTPFGRVPRRTTCQRGATGCGYGTRARHAVRVARCPGAGRGPRRAGVASQWRIRHKLMLGLGLVVAIMALLVGGTLRGLWPY